MSMIAAGFAAVSVGVSVGPWWARLVWVVLGFGCLGVGAGTVWRLGKRDHLPEWKSELAEFGRLVGVVYGEVETKYDQQYGLSGRSEFPASWQEVVRELPWSFPAGDDGPVAAWSAGKNEWFAFQFIRGIYGGRPLRARSNLGARFDAFHDARHRVKDMLDAWGTRASEDQDFAAFLDANLPRYRDFLLTLAYLEVNLARALGTSEADAPGFWRLGKRYCENPNDGAGDAASPT